MEKALSNLKRPLCLGASPPQFPPPRCRFPTELIIEIFGWVQNGEFPGCSICRMHALYRCCLVSRTVKQVAAKLLYENLDLRFDTNIRLDAIPNEANRSPTVRRAIARYPWVVLEQRLATRMPQPCITSCPIHMKHWREKDCSYTFRQQERVLKLLLRTLRTGMGPHIARTIKTISFPAKNQYPWELGTMDARLHPAAVNIVPHLVDILEILPCLESVIGLGDIAAFINLIPRFEPLRRSTLTAVAVNENWKKWDWGEYQNPNKLRYLSHFGTNTSVDFIKIHENWKDLRELNFGVVLLEEPIGNSFPFHHLPSLRCLSLSGTHSFDALFEALPPNQLSSLTIQPGSYGGYASKPLIKYLQQPIDEVQRLTSLTMLAAVDDTLGYMIPFRPDHFISAVLQLAPRLQHLKLALPPRTQLPPIGLLRTAFKPEEPLTMLYAPGPYLKTLTLVISAHDWSWLVPSLRKYMFPAIRSITITNAQYVDGMEGIDNGQTLLTFVHSNSPPPARRTVKILQGAGRERCKQIDEGLVEFCGEKKVSQGGVMLKFINNQEEDEILLGKDGRVSN